VENIVNKYPHLQRPQILNPSKSKAVKRLKKILSNEFLTVIDPRKDEMITYSQALKLLEEEKCKTCKIEEKEVLFLPCGHLVCCSTCSKNIERCVICLSSINARIQTFKN